MKIIAIVGSPRSTGNTNYLIDQALQEADTQGFETDKIILSQYQVNPCLGHANYSSFEMCQQDDDAHWILDKSRSADGIILGNPVYYYNMTAQMKAFVDRNYFLYTHGIPFNALCAGLIVVAGDTGMDHTVRALRRFVKLSTDMPEDNIIILTRQASKPGDVKSNLP